MKPSEIRPGETYHNGRGRQRVVRAVKTDGNDVFVVYAKPALSEAFSCTLATFARWARGRVTAR